MYVPPERLVVVAVFRARPGSESELRTRLTEMLATSRAESGCVRYDLHQVDRDPALFFFDEIWLTPADHATHLRTPHVEQLLKDTMDLLAGPITEYRGTRVEQPSAGDTIFA